LRPVYLVLNDFGPLGRAYVETDEASASERDAISSISSGEHSKPIRAVAFNTAEGWSRYATEDIAETLLERDASEGDLSESATTFVGRVLNTATWCAALAGVMPTLYHCESSKRMRGIEIQVTGAPVAMGYCHCNSCRSYSGSPVNAYLLWKAEDVTVTKERNSSATLKKRK